MNFNLTKLQIQKPVFTASLEHSLTVLLLSHAELTTTIEQELQENPLLEAETPQEQDAAFDWNQINALANLSSANFSDAGSEEDQNQESFSMVSMMTLEDHLFQQLYWDIPESAHRKIGEYIIGNLDKDGYLHLTLEEIAEHFDISDLSLINNILETIQNFDPVGIGTRNLKECLTVQLRKCQSPLTDLAIWIINEHWDDLGHKRYAGLAKKLNVRMEQIAEAAHLISSLEPKPARNYRNIEPTVYVQPDIYVRKDEEGRYIVETNKRNIPALRINQTYRKMLNRPNISLQEKTFIQEKLNNALNFIKNIQQRGTTLTAVTRYILEHQKKFFDGEEPVLTPMSLKDVALYLDRCESTISRAVNNKYIETPQGLFPLKFFFSHSVASHNNEEVSAHAIKEEIAELISDEDKKHPLSDQDIQKHFEAKGLHLARRTVAKYRQMLHIPSSHQRNKD